MLQDLVGRRLWASERARILGSTRLPAFLGKDLNPEP